MTKIIKNYEFISVNLPKIGTSDDSNKLRETIARALSQANEFNTNSESELKKMRTYLNNSDKEIKQVAWRIVEDFNRLKESLKKLNQLSKDLLDETVIPKQIRQDNSSLYADVDDDDNDNAQLIQKTKDHLKLDKERDFQDAIIHEREDEIKAIQQQMREVNDIFKDLANIVQEQGEMVDSIYLNITSASKNVDVGVQNLEEANTHQKSARNRMCYLAIFITVAVSIAVVVVVLFFSNKK